MHLAALEKINDGDTSKSSLIPNLARSMLVFLVKGLFNSLCFPYAHFPCINLSGGLMYDLVWEAVLCLETCGLKVMEMTCDGLTANRKLFRLQNPDAKPGDIVHKVTNPCADDGRNFYFFADSPCLLKTVRIAWCNTKRSFGYTFCVIKCNAVYI